MSEILLERPKEYLSLAEIAGVGNEGRFLRISPDGTRIEPVSLLDLRDVGIHGLTTGMVRLYEDGSVDGHSGQAFTRRGIIGVDSSGYVTSVIAGYDPTGSWWFNPDATGDKLVWASSSPGPDWTQVEPGEAVFGKGLITSELLVTPIDWQTQIAGTGKPEDNATLGATWGSNIDGQPSDSELLNVEVANNLNVLPDPNFSRSNTDGFGVWWFGEGTIDAAGGENGTPALRIDADGTINDVLSKNLIPAKAGDKFYVWIRYKTTSDYNGAASLGISSFDANKLDVHAWPNIALPLTGGSWATATGTITVSNGTANGIYTQFIRVRPSVRESATAGSLYVDQIYFGRAEPEATVGAPNDSPLGGITVQDSVVGDGVFFTANGIEGWKAGSRTFLLDAVTGDATFSGTLAGARVETSTLTVDGAVGITMESGSDMRFEATWDPASGIAEYSNLAFAIDLNDGNGMVDHALIQMNASAFVISGLDDTWEIDFTSWKYIALVASYDIFLDAVITHLRTSTSEFFVDGDGAHVDSKLYLVTDNASPTADSGSVVLFATDDGTTQYLKVMWRDGVTTTLASHTY